MQRTSHCAVVAAAVFYLLPLFLGTLVGVYLFIHMCVLGRRLLQVFEHRIFPFGPLFAQRGVKRERTNSYYSRPQAHAAPANPSFTFASRP